jgi:hypothetical protein
MTEPNEVSEPRVTGYSITSRNASGWTEAVAQILPGAGPPELHLAAALAATQVLWDGDWEGSAATPERLQVTETSELQTSRVVFEEERLPELIAATPSTGPQAGGTSVTITGRNLGPASIPSWSFHFTIRPGVDGYARAEIVDSETITCVTPPMGAAGLAAMHLYLEAPGGGIKASLPDAFTFV